MKGANVSLVDYSDATLFSIIEEVRKHKSLYDIPHKDRSAVAVVHKRSNLWREISELFSLSTEEVLGIWKKLRSTFTRYLKHYHTSKELGRSYNPSTWKYFDSLVFLIPHIEYGPPHNMRSSQHSQQSHSAVSSIAKKALKRSKNILLKHKEGNFDMGYQSGGSTIELDVARLVELVKTYPIIYSKPTSTYNSGDKMDAWKAIAEEMGLAPRTCVTKWIYLWRKLQTEEKNPYKEKWEWYSIMKFFVPYQASRSRKVTTSQYSEDGMEDSDMHLNYENNSETNVASSNSLFVDTLVTEGANNFTPSFETFGMLKEEARELSRTPSHSGIGDGPSNGSTRGMRDVKVSSSEYHFGICTAEMLEGIPAMNRARVKAKIFQVLADAM